jgi:hypothetical protein
MATPDRAAAEQGPLVLWNQYVHSALGYASTLEQCGQ